MLIIVVLCHLWWRQVSFEVSLLSFNSTVDDDDGGGGGGGGDAST